MRMNDRKYVIHKSIYINVVASTQKKIRNFAKIYEKNEILYFMRIKK